MTRVAFYSHDTFGLGHLRRTLKLAGALQRSLGEVEGLLITGSPWAGLFQPPSGFEVAVLPPIVKRGKSYEPRADHRGLAETLADRRTRLEARLAEFRPDILIVVNVPCGLKGEMLPALRRVKQLYGTRCVLALRDVLDRIERVRSEWSEARADEALQILYDEVWVFGTSDSCTWLREITELSHGTPCIPCGRLGLDGPNAMCSQPEDKRIQVGRSLPQVLVTGGGGGDAMRLVETYIEMLRLLNPPVVSQIVLGPDFCSRTWSSLDKNNGFAATINAFLPDLPRAMTRADVVVAMAGYNSICELEATGSRSVLVPRVWPREEQLIRAESQERAGRAIMIHPRDLAPEPLWGAIQRALERPRPEPIPHHGAEVAAHRAVELLGLEHPERWTRP